MVIFQILLEHENFFEQSSWLGTSGPKNQAITGWVKIQENEYFHLWPIFRTKEKGSTIIWQMTMFHLSHCRGKRSYLFFDGAWSLLTFFGAWSLLKFSGAWSLLKFFWSMVIFQILLEHGCFLIKALGSRQSGPKTKSLLGGWKFKKMNASIYGRFLEPKKRVPP